MWQTTENEGGEIVYEGGFVSVDVVGADTWPYICSRCRVQLERPRTHLCHGCAST